MNEKLAQALSHVEDIYVSRAAKRKKIRKLWIPAIAAVLAMVFFWRTPTIPLAVSAKAVSLAPESRAMNRPHPGSEDFQVWYEERMARKEILDGCISPIQDFSRAWRPV